jgi:hypothetical protein
MLKDTENNATLFLLRRRSQFYKLMLMHITRNGNPFHLKTKNYLTRIILLHKTDITSLFLLIREIKLKKDAAKHKKPKKVSLS